MAESSGQVSYGSFLKYDSGGGSYVAISEVRSIDGIDVTIKDVDFTHLQSDNAAHEYKPGMIEGNSVSCELNYTDTSFLLLQGFYRSIKDWRIVYPDATYTPFRGFVTQLKNNAAGGDDPVATSLTIKVTGKPVHV